MRIPALPILMIILVRVSSSAVAGSVTGSVIVQIQGYGTVHGQLENELIQANDSVTTSTVVNDQLQT